MPPPTTNTQGENGDAQSMPHSTVDLTLPSLTGRDCGDSSSLDDPPSNSAVCGALFVSVPRQVEASCEHHGNLKGSNTAHSPGPSAGLHFAGHTKKSGKGVCGTLGFLGSRILSLVKRFILGPTDSVVVGILRRWYWIVSKYLVILAQSVRVYFGLYHGARILLDVWGLFALHIIGRLGILRPQQWLSRLFLGGSVGRQMIMLHRRLRQANTYEEWQAVSEQLDEVTGQAAWTLTADTPEDSHLCDFPALSSHTAAMRQARLSSNWQELAFLLRVGCQRDFCHLRNPALYAHSFVKTKRAIDSFEDEICLGLQAIVHCNNDINSKDEDVTISEATTIRHENDISACTPVVASQVSAPDTSVDSDFAASQPLTQRETHDLIASLRLAMGRTALCLSGGGGLAMFHPGVIKTLIEQKLMPRVFSGSSGGSVIAGMLATHSDEDFIKEFCRPDHLVAKCLQMCPPLWQQVRSLLRTGYALDPKEFEDYVRAILGDCTFAEAFARTGRFVSITTTPAGRRAAFSEPLVCNCINTPDVLVWSAVVASCSLPLVLPPSVLLTKRRRPSSDKQVRLRRRRQSNRHQYARRLAASCNVPTPWLESDIGPTPSQSSHEDLAKLAISRSGGVKGDTPEQHRIPGCAESTGASARHSKYTSYAPEGMRFVDGSILQDIPHTELQTLFNVKSFIVAQVNPHFTPFIPGPASHRKAGGIKMLLDALWNYLAQDLRHRYGRLLILALVPKIKGQDVSPFILQAAEGHITIVPATPSDFWRLTCNPSPQDIARGVVIGSRKTWPYINRIRHTLRIESLLRDLYQEVSVRPRHPETPRHMLSTTVQSGRFYELSTAKVDHDQFGEADERDGLGPGELDVSRSAVHLLARAVARERQSENVSTLRGTPL